jgi:hypothetical protein
MEFRPQNEKATKDNVNTRLKYFCSFNEKWGEEVFACGLFWSNGEHGTTYMWGSESECLWGFL